LRGQVSFEFFVALSFLILLFMVSFEIYENETQSMSLSVSRMSSQYIALDFARAINGVYRCGNGCSYALQLKGGYSLSVNGRAVQVSYGSGSSQAPLVTDSVTLQSATPGANIVVRNNNGVVELHDA
jgi:hypothetical protein